MSFVSKHKFYIIAIAILLFAGIIGVVIYFNKGKVITYTDSDDDSVFLKDYDLNQFVPVYVTDGQMVSIYYNNYINKMLYKREEAYSMLDEKFKKSKFPNYSDYDNYVEKSFGENYNFSIESFEISDSKYGKIYSIKDNRNYSYTFDVIGVMVYDVSFTTEQ